MKNLKRIEKIVLKTLPDAKLGSKVLFNKIFDKASVLTQTEKSRRFKLVCETRKRLHDELRLIEEAHSEGMVEKLDNVNRWYL